MKSITFLGPILASLLLAPGVSSGALNDWYTDVPENHAYYNGIYYGTQAGFLTGYEDGSFGPMSPVNRVEALKMILEGNEVPLEWTEPADFPDIEAEAWYINYLNTAAALEIVSGHEDGSFKPLDTVNRAEALKMLVLATGLQSELPGVANDAWYTAYLQYGIDHALIIPDKAGDYLPGNALTRGELADLIYRFKEQPFTSHVEYGIASYYGYSFDGHNTASGTALNAYGFMAAHKTLPFGTVIRVTNLDTLMTVDVEVVDRGPYTEGYSVDLTPAAFEQIGALSTGILNTRLEVLNQ